MAMRCLSASAKGSRPTGPAKPLLSRKNRIWAAAAVLLTLWSGTAFAELRVIARAGPSAARFPLGARFPDNHRIVLRAGDTLTLLRSGGGQVVLRGPGTGTAAQLAAPR